MLRSLGVSCGGLLGEGLLLATVGVQHCVLVPGAGEVGLAESGFARSLEGCWTWCVGRAAQAEGQGCGDPVEGGAGRPPTIVKPPPAVGAWSPPVPSSPPVPRDFPPQPWPAFVWRGQELIGFGAPL